MTDIDEIKADYFDKGYEEGYKRAYIEMNLPIKESDQILRDGEGKLTKEGLIEDARRLLLRCDAGVVLGMIGDDLQMLSLYLDDENVVNLLKHVIANQNRKRIVTPEIFLGWR